MFQDTEKTSRSIDLDSDSMFLFTGWGKRFAKQNRTKDILDGTNLTYYSYTKTPFNITFQYIPEDHCIWHRTNHLNENQFCVMGESGETDCHGDGGGPLIQQIAGKFKKIWTKSKIDY